MVFGDDSKFHNIALQVSEHASNQGNNLAKRNGL